MGDVLITNIDYKEVSHDRYYLLNRSAHDNRELYIATNRFYQRKEAPEKEIKMGRISDPKI